MQTFTAIMKDAGADAVGIAVDIDEDRYDVDADITVHGTFANEAEFIPHGDEMLAEHGFRRVTDWQFRTPGQVHDTCQVELA